MCGKLVFNSKGALLGWKLVSASAILNYIEFGGSTVFSLLPSESAVFLNFFDTI